MRRLGALVIVVAALVGIAYASGGPSVQRTLTSPVREVPGQERWRPMVSDPEMARWDELEDRARWRAYDGAPPVMPHSRNFAKRKTCLECHADGIQLGERFGPAVSHPQLLNCQQCHVESRNLDLPFPEPVVENSFEGRLALLEGHRAASGAPPVMPHTTLMRTRCLSCHDSDGAPGIRIDHPQRMNCLQCHAVPARLDQSSPYFRSAATR